MALDFQICMPQESIRLTKIRLTPPNNVGLPRGIDVIGQDFRSVDEVLINDMPSPDVLILSKNRLIAQLPDALQASLSVSSVSVLSRKLTITDRSFIRFRIADVPGKVSGILRLLQLFLKILFTTPGTDIFSQKTGGAALRNVGQTFGKDDSSDIVTDFIIAVGSTTKQIISLQGRGGALPPDERLLSARVLRAGFNRELGGILASIEVISQAGRAATANLEL